MADNEVADVAARGLEAGTTCGGRSRSNSLRTSSGEGKRQWVMNNYKFKDAHNPTTAAAGADGNKDNGKNDSNDNNKDRRTSSAWSNFIVRILFLTLLLLAYYKLFL